MDYYKLDGNGNKVDTNRAESDIIVYSWTALDLCHNGSAADLFVPCIICQYDYAMRRSSLSQLIVEASKCQARRKQGQTRGGQWSRIFEYNRCTFQSTLVFVWKILFFNFCFCRTFVWFCLKPTDCLLSPALGRSICTNLLGIRCLPQGHLKM